MESATDSVLVVLLLKIFLEEDDDEGFVFTTVPASR